MSAPVTSAGPLGGAVLEPHASYTPAPARTRLDAVDMLRGLVMVVMLLDHARDFTHASGSLYDPADITRTTPILFFTRWLTHFCAPVFVFLAGTGAYLQLARGRTKGELSRFLVSRGFWLIVLEFTVVRLFAFWEFDVALMGMMMQVIWVIGVSMIILAGLIHLPLRAVAAIGLAMIVGHNLLDGVRIDLWFPSPQLPRTPGALEKLWVVLHQGGLFPLLDYPSQANPQAAAGPVVLVLYPLIPWIGVLAVGYAFGAVYRWDAERRRRWLLKVGLAATLAFVVLRAANFIGNPIGFDGSHGYGDPRPWRTTIQVPVSPAPAAAPTPGAPPAMRTVELSPAMTVVSFFNTQKYPPSLLYLLMTLGPALLLLRQFERLGDRGRVGRALVTFGRVPLFFYLGQWVVAHGGGLLLALAAGKPTALFFQNVLAWRPGPEHGFPLWVGWALWFVGTLLLYPLCRWYAGVKARRKDWWLSYL